MRENLTSPRIILVFGVFAVTSSAFIITQAEKNIENYNPYVLAFSRVFFTGLISLVFLRRYQITENKISKNDFSKILLAGLSLATHFGWWFDSLYYDIPIGVSLSLTNTAPIWIAILVLVIYKIELNNNQKLAIIFVIIGSAILFIDQSKELENQQTKGLILAMSSSLGFAIYLLLAKDMVPRLGLWRYFGFVNLTAASVILVWIFIINKEAILLSPSIYYWGLILALIPGLCGHAIYNFAMSKVPAVDVGIATLGEPILGTIIAWLFLKEHLSSIQLFGIFLLIIAISFTIEIKKNKN